MKIKFIEMCASYARARKQHAYRGPSGGRGVRIPKVPVDLDLIGDPLARQMVQAILTTDRDDDACRVLLRSRRYLETDRPIFDGTTMVQPGTARHRELVAFWGIKPQPCRWTYDAWDAWRPDETAEEYFTRHAREARGAGDDLVVVCDWLGKELRGAS